MSALPLISQIADVEPSFQRLADDELRDTGLELRYRAKTGEPLKRLLPETFALVREAATRGIGQRQFDVQLLAGIALANGNIAEMQAGEGKTLTASLALALYALAGRGAHLATANPYLAERDAGLMRPVFERIGLTVGVVLPNVSREERLHAYRCDITYGTVSEFGFDLLRDRLYGPDDQSSGTDQTTRLFSSRQHSTYQPVQRGHHFGLVDEADSVLIDDAGMPLIIGLPATPDGDDEEPLFRWAASVVGSFEEGIDFTVLPAGGSTFPLTEVGRERARRLPKPDTLNPTSLIDIYEAVERAIAVDRRYQFNRQYLVDDGKAVIIDENTGRPAEGRSWRGGVHQAVEAKEGLPLTDRTDAAATITVQSYFRRYNHLAGLTATARESAREFRRVYGLRVQPIPLHRPSQRVELPARCYATQVEKLSAILEETLAFSNAGRPVLIGTRSIHDSQGISAALSQHGIAHEVLNAEHLQREAAIVENAGRSGRVTVATNMAGRGTDIPLDDAARDSGGLHVIASEMHPSPRIDRQLFGRGGRHGEPGSYRQYASFEDRLLHEAGVVMSQLPDISNPEDPESLRMFRGVQTQLATRDAHRRRLLLRSDELRTERERALGLDEVLQVVE